jgi:hypothetical protein
MLALILTCMSAVTSLPIPDASVFQKATQDEARASSGANALHQVAESSFGSLSLEDELRLQLERLEQMQSQGRVAQAVEIANHVAILQQQIQQRQRAQSRISVVERLAVSRRSSESIVSIEADSIVQQQPQQQEQEVVKVQEAFVIQVATVRYDAPAPPVSNPNPVVPENPSPVMDLTAEEDGTGEVESAAPVMPQQSAQTKWKDYEDIAVYVGCVLAMVLVLYLLSIAVRRREKMDPTIVYTDSPTQRMPRCPDVFQKVWSSGMSVRQLRRVSSNHNHVCASPILPSTPNTTFGECHVGLQNRILSNFDGTNEH